MSEEEEYTDEEYEEEVEEEIVESAPPSPAKPKLSKEEIKDEKFTQEEEEQEKEELKSPIKKELPIQEKEDEKELQELHPQLRKTEQKQKEPEEKELTEAEIAMIEARKRHEAEEEAKMVGYEERRKQEMEQLDKELNELKEQHKRRLEERKKEEAEMAAIRKQDEERRRKEEEQRKLRADEEKAKKEAERHKRQMMMAGSFIGGTTGEKGVRNFVIEKRGDGEDKLGLKSEGGPRRKGPSAAEAAEAKRNYMAIVNRPVDVSNMLPNDIKAKIKQLYARIVKLEGEKYDLEKRKGRQEYDLKELSERQKQAARQKALNTGVDPTEVDDSNFPPKVRVASKFDRKTDRREYGERREMFENPNAPSEPEIAHGSGRPPSEWGRKELEELEQIRKNLEPPKYMEQVKAEGEAARPPVPIIPLQIPGNWNPEKENINKKKRISLKNEENEEEIKINEDNIESSGGGGGGWRERTKLKEKEAPAPPPKTRA
ncbi:hypothetical protein Mgra_00009713 [Meloidogyne graminicola]|uniref:Troponin T n=1 Tax=Meloidogyne graminicola TaxID=189291 RepID=A0A8S9ZBW2_9BILA|nr:hypothetical protein Mgra_00009713 [Meloidogyne graminicola]